MEKRLTILMLLTMALSTFADIITLKPDVDESQDVYVIEDSPDSNPEGAGFFGVRPRESADDGRVNSYLRFNDLDDYIGSRLNSAELRLRLYRFEEHTATWTICAAAADWDESTITWNSQPYGIDTTNIIVNYPATGGWYNIDVTSIVREWLEYKVEHHGFHLFDPGMDDRTWNAIAADDGATPAYHPELILDIEESAVVETSWGEIKALE